MDEQRQGQALTGRGAAAVMARSARWRRWSWVGGMTGVAATVAALVVIFLILPEIRLAQPAASEVRLAESGLVWSSVPGTVGGFSGVVIGGSDGRLYALSTAPGLRELPVNAPPAYSLYTSTDGEVWESEPLAGFGDDLWARGIAEADGRVYVVGTAPSTSRPGGVAVRLGSSTDGRNWTAVEFPLDTQPPANLEGRGLVTTVAKVAAGSRGVVVAGNAVNHVDYSSLVPAGFAGEGTSVVRTDTGIQVVDFGPVESAYRSCEIAMSSLPQGAPRPAACVQADQMSLHPPVVYQATWEELGIIPEPVARVSLMFSPDGSRFDPVAPPFADDRVLVELGASDLGFFAVTRSATSGMEQPKAEGWFSADGTRWVASEGSPPVEMVMALGGAGGSTVMVGQTRTDLAVASTTDGLSWRTIDMSDLLPVLGPGDNRWVSAAGVGPFGVAISLHSWLQAAGREPREVVQLLHSSDLEQWSTLATNSIASGFVYQVAVGDDFVFLNVSGTRHQHLIGSAG
jgi:hypothetical protein